MLTEEPRAPAQAVAADGIFPEERRELERVVMGVGVPALGSWEVGGRNQPTMALEKEEVHLPTSHSPDPSLCREVLSSGSCHGSAWLLITVL